MLPPLTIIQRKGEITLTELEYQEHIRHTHNAFCRIVIRHAAIDMALRLRKRCRAAQADARYVQHGRFFQVPF